VAYCFLFFVSFAAATLLPGGSEAYLLYLRYQDFSPFYLLLIATSGNTLGSLVNYILGKYAYAWSLKKDYVKTLHVTKAKKYFDKYGFIALLFSWLPIIGDPITFVAGVLRYNLSLFLLLVTLSKFTRYVFILYLYRFFT
jgi:membrane protein YqaA with SNARE-associated domain